MTIRTHQISREAERATSIITDYLTAKHKEIEDPLYAIFRKSSSPSDFSDNTISKVKEIDILVFKIFKEKVRIFLEYSPSSQIALPTHTQKYVITANGEIYVDTSCYLFKGGLNLSAKHLHLIVEESTISLTKKVSQRLLTYIIQGPPKFPFQCSDFVDFISGQYDPKISKSLDINQKWKVAAYQKEHQDFSTEEVAVFGTLKGKNTIHFTHFAFALGPQFFLSVIGNQGELDVMTKENALEIWNAEQAIHIVPTGQA